MHEVLDVVRAIAGDVEEAGERRGAALRDVQALVEAAVDLDLGDRAEPDADADSRHRQPVAAQAADRIEDVALEVETRLRSGPGRRR